MADTINPWGVDMACVSDLDPMLRDQTGVMVYLEAIARRLQTPRGMLIGAPDYGLDIRGFLHGAVDLTRGPRLIAAKIEAECLKDERTTSCRASVRFLGAASNLTMEVDLDLDTSFGPFKLTLVASQVTVAILRAG